MLTELRKRKDEHSENFNKEIGSMKMGQSEQKNTLTEVKNTLEGINSRLGDKEQISDLEDKIMKITQSESEKKDKIF